MHRFLEAEDEVRPVKLFYITNRSKAILLWWFFLFYVLVFNFYMPLAPYVRFQILVKFG